MYNNTAKKDENSYKGLGHFFLVLFFDWEAEFKQPGKQGFFIAENQVGLQLTRREEYNVRSLKNQLGEA